MILLDNFMDIPVYIDKEIEIVGFVSSIRNLKNFVFIILRRNNKLIQCICKDISIFDNNMPSIESTVKITGYVNLRSQNTINNNQDLGKYEIKVNKIDIISKSKPLPFPIHHSQNNSADLRERFRFLDLRNNISLALLHTRIKAIKLTRQFFENMGFLEINTPILTGITQDGANNYIVKSRRYKDKFYALAQSPQLYKQILMCSDIEKYYQIAPCFRDEESRSNRLCTEFTQIDIEMKADNMNIITDIIINYIKFLSQELLGKNIQVKQMNYSDIINQYSTDQVDLRVWNKFNIRKHNNCLAFSNIDNIYKELKNTFCDIRLCKDEILIDVNSNQKNSLLMHLSNVYNNMYNTDNTHFVTVVYNYPFYEIDDNGEQVFKHNPFSKTFISNNNVYAYQYDIIMDAQEIAGGSLRETNVEKLKNYIQDNSIVNFIDMYNYGFIEHGGFALGLERFLSILYNKPIENFVPFFTSKNGSSSLVISPNSL